jgi:hypothetical protein
VLRRDDILAAALRVVEAIVRGRVKGTKTEESAAVMYLPPDLELEVKHYLGALSDPARRDGCSRPVGRKLLSVREIS